MPSASGVSLSFYALGVGLGFATVFSALIEAGLRFYALGVGLGFATNAGPELCRDLVSQVSMPSVSGWALRQVAAYGDSSVAMRFYALGVGLGFATTWHDWTKKA